MEPAQNFLILEPASLFDNQQADILNICLIKYDKIPGSEATFSIFFSLQS